MTPHEAKLDIPDRHRPALESALLKEHEQMVHARYDMDENLLTWDRMLRMDPSWAGIKPRYKGGAYIESTLTREHHLQITAAYWAVMMQDQWYTCNATKPGDEQDAADLEQLLNDAMDEYDLRGVHGYDLAYNAARHTNGILYCGWRQHYRTKYFTVHEDRETKQRVLASQRDPDRDYDEIEEAYEEVDREGFEFRVCHHGDFYLYPPDAQSVEQAVRVGERLYMSANQLLDGIEDEDYDADAVYRTISGGKSDDSQAETPARERNDADGLHPEEGGLYEVFWAYGKPPLLRDNEGKPLLKPEQRRRDYMWLYCPAARTVLKFVPLPYDERPHVIFPCVREPGRLFGDAVTTLAAPLQHEDTVALRARIDGRDIAASPMWMVPEEDYRDLELFKSFPGAKWPYKRQYGPQSVAPVATDLRGLELFMQDSQDLNFRAARMFSSLAQGFAPNQGMQPRTATEINNASAGADQKLDLIIGCFGIGLKQLARVMLSHWRQFGQANLSEPRLIGNKAVTLRPEVLEKRFRIVPCGSSADTDPTIRMQRAEMLYKFAMSNPLLQQAAQRGDLRGIWALSAELARYIKPNIDVQGIFGKQPPAPPTPDMALELMFKMLQQYAMQGDPAAVQMLQALQKMQQSGYVPPIPGQGQTGPQPGGGNEPMKVTANFKDLPDYAQAQFLKMDGVQVPQSAAAVAPQPAGTRPPTGMPMPRPRNGVH